MLKLSWHQKQPPLGCFGCWWSQHRTLASLVTHGLCSRDYGNTLLRYTEPESQTVQYAESNKQAGEGVGTFFQHPIHLLSHCF